jgi:nicotinamide-nucleotide amidase
MLAGGKIGYGWIAVALAIISIGDEITTGSIVDTNSAWISDFMISKGIETMLHLSVPDNLTKITGALRTAQNRARIVIVSGGLGPTEDDMTTQAACRFFRVEPVLNQEALQAIEDRFRAIDREMTENNRKQAMIPEGAEVLQNPIGTAPGYALANKKALFFFVPGVPAECRRMIQNQVWPKIPEMEKNKKIFRSITLRTFGLTESQLDQYLSEIRFPTSVRIGFRAVFPEIHVKITASKRDEDAVEKNLARAKLSIYQKVGDYIYTDQELELEEVIGEILRARKKTLAIAESITGGLITKRITDIPGSSDYLLAGYITYSNQDKIKTLGVPKELIEQKGAVSSEVAKAMAESARKKAGANMAVSTTGIAGPTGGTSQKPMGTVHLALADESGTWERRFSFLRPERRQIRELAAEAGLEIIRRRLLGLKEPE